MRALLTILHVALGSTLLWAQTTTTFVVKKDTLIEEPAPPAQFYLVEAYGSEAQSMWFKSPGGHADVKAMKQANLIYTNDANVVVTGFDLRYREKNQWRTLHSDNHWLTPEMVKVMKKLKKDDVVVFDNIQYQDENGETCNATPLEFRAIKRQHQPFFGSKGGVITNGDL